MHIKKYFICSIKKVTRPNLYNSKCGFKALVDFSNSSELLPAPLNDVTVKDT